MINQLLEWDRPLTIFTIQLPLRTLELLVQHVLLSAKRSTALTIQL